MKIFKSHFWYSKSQRNGVLFLIVIIAVLQLTYIFIKDSSGRSEALDDQQLIIAEKYLDSLRAIQKEKTKFKKYPFNPNFISDFKGYQLGMSLEEIERLHNFRKQNKFVNSNSDFKKVTKISDSLLNKIAPYFKFPNWVQNQKEKKALKKESLVVNNQKEKEVVVKDINLASAKDFMLVKGIGVKLAERIVKYRTRLQGFSFTNQMYEVWGLDSIVVKEVLGSFVLKSKPKIVKININTASFKEVLKTPYVDYDVCKKIFNYKDEVAEIQDISELKNIEGFPVNKYDRIVLYLNSK